MVEKFPASSTVYAQMCVCVHMHMNVCARTYECARVGVHTYISVCIQRENSPILTLIWKEFLFSSL